MRKFLHWSLQYKFFLRSIKAVSVLMILCGAAARAQVSGAVFADFDANGVQSHANPYEPGMPDVSIRIFVGKSNVPAAVVQTDSAGKYAFSAAQAPKDSMIRVEFFDFPETFSNGLAGPQSGTNVQFVKAPAANINLGIFNDDEFCTSAKDVKIVTACYAMGDPLKGGDAGEDPALVIFDYNAKGQAGTDDLSMEKLAKAKAIGSTWIAAYQRSSFTLLLGTITRRHVGVGPLGTGGYYAVNLKTNQVSNFLDVKTIGIDTGPDPHIDPVTNLNILPASKLARSRDSLAFQLAGRVGLGGSQLSAYQDTLFLVNLYDRKLYSFSVGKPLGPPANAAEAAVKSRAIPHPNCSNGDFAPWALKYYRGKLYVGVVCTAEKSHKKEDLKAAVYEYNPTTTQYKNIFEFNLNYSRGPIDGTQGCDTITTWLPWTKVFPKQCNYPLGAPDPIAAFAVYPQPILSDLEFDDDGSLILSFLDRLGLQTGQNQPGIAVDDTLNYYGFMSGDMVRAQRNANGTFTLENNAKSGDLQGCGPNTNSGPGGGEFFCEDYWLNGQGGVGHAEITNGGMFKIAGVPEVLVSAMDPVHGIYLSTGFIAFDTKTGKRNRSFSVYSLSPGSLGKSGGVGDLTGVCDPAPLEIGNLVWLDVDKDGIQEGNEILLDSIVVTLHDMENGGVEVARDTTSSHGQYYFNDTNVPGGLKRNHKYEIRLALDQEIQVDILSLPDQTVFKSASTQKVKLKDTLTVSPKQVAGYHQNFIRDSDAEYNTDSTSIIIKITTGDNSQTNHSEDIGFVIKNISEEKIDLELSKRTIGDCIRVIGDEVVFELVVKNAATAPTAIADSVYIADILPANFTFISSAASQGAYNQATHLWGPLLLEPGQSDTLTLKVKINQTFGFEGGSICNEAEIVKAVGPDLDSEPNNGLKAEDDYAIACISVPLKICTERRDTVIISAPAGYASYQWFKDGVKIDGATAQTLEVGAVGAYSVEVSDGQCPAKNCCPAVVQEDCICPEECLPFTVKKIKTSGSSIPLSKK